MNPNRKSWLEYWRDSRHKETAWSGAESAYEVCILCGAATQVPKSTPVELRCDYLPGAGQLCRKCAEQNILEERSAMRCGFVYEIPQYQEGK